MNTQGLARYLERAESSARLISATTQVLLDLPRNASFGWDVLVSVAGLEKRFREARHLAMAVGGLDAAEFDAAACVLDVPDELLASLEQS